MPSSNRAKLLLLAIVFALLGHESIAATPANQTGQEKITVGNWYAIPVPSYPVVVGHESKTELSGCLVNLTDEWIVLSDVRTVIRATGVPWICDIPYLGALFRKTSVSEVRVTMWIPRVAVKENELKPIPNKPVAGDFKNDAPKLEGLCRVFYSDGKNDLSGTGEVSGIVNGQISVAGENKVTKIELDKLHYIAQQVTLERPAITTKQKTERK